MKQSLSHSGKSPRTKKKKTNVDYVCRVYAIYRVYRITFLLKVYQENKCVYNEIDV